MIDSVSVGARVARRSKPVLQPWMAYEWLGTILDQDDPRAWGGSVAFYDKPVLAEDTAKHVAWCHEQGLLPPTEFPVLWEFRTAQGDPEPKVYWENVNTVEAA